MADERTEEATPKRREDERKKGNIARSQDMTAALTVTAGVGLLFAFSSSILEKLKNLLYYTCTHLNPDEIEVNDIITIFAPYAKITGEILLPFLIGLAAVTAIIMRLQVGPLFATEKIKPKIDKLVAKGLLPRPARVVVVGMPNVGKSSIINKLIKKGKTKVGAKAGVTRQQQWVRVNPKIDLLDTPGIIPLKQEDQTKAGKLAMVNSVSENAYENEEVASELIDILKTKYPEQLREYYKLENEFSLEAIAKSRNWIVKNEEPDVTRTAVMVLTDFRAGRIGKFTLDNMEQQDE